MSYQVIARKWRPNSFTELVGQNHISQTLTNALQSHRLPHALLFTGPRGTGKTSSARILAKALRCPSAKDFTPCNQCDQCQQITDGSSLDVIEIDGASNNGVDAIRELRETVGYMPSQGQYKIYIIDEVHMLSTSAFNALLKTLEEPPEHVIFILATTEAHKIPNTILSRCQRFDFRRIPTKIVSDKLEQICQDENVKTEPEALWMIARQGDGYMRDSQSLLDQVITFSKNDITLQKVVEILGLTDRKLLTETLSALVERNTEKIIDIIDRLFKSGFNAKIFIQDLLEEVRHLLLVKLAYKQTNNIVDLPATEIEFLHNLSHQLSEEDIHMLFDMALKGGNDIPKALEPRIVLEMLLLRMAAAPRIQSLKDISFTSSTKLNTPSETSKPVEVHPVAEKPKPIQPARPSAPAQKEEKTAKMGIPDGSLEEKWLQLVTRIKKINSLIAAKLEHSYLKEMTEKSLVIAIPEKMKFLQQQIDEPDFKRKLVNYVNTFWGQQFDIQVYLDSARAEKKNEILTPKALSDQKKENQDKQSKTQVENHPLMKTTQSLFKTQIKLIKETQ